MKLSAVTRHKAFKHDIGVTWFFCDEPECLFRAKTDNGVKQHKMQRHNKNITWFYCDVPGCTSYQGTYPAVAKTAAKIKAHKRLVHGVGLTYIKCPDCDYQAKSSESLVKHRVSKHNYVHVPKKKFVNYTGPDYANRDRKVKDKNYWNNVPTTWKPGDPVDFATLNPLHHPNATGAGVAGVAVAGAGAVVPAAGGAGGGGSANDEEEERGWEAAVDAILDVPRAPAFPPMPPPLLAPLLTQASHMQVPLPSIPARPRTRSAGNENENVIL
ncbi:hypothetical protein TeGR_g1133 [Tetraparma gracilis]|uniref:C2H2-type domain-containing protein n=1 Tax=Tetraparma gracilis TaxID=2962635 RepID=A0ABQ6M974_9STRA|nr:hypothetical protein TeGR_g1133 [Tetraparma gracilis]